MTRILALALLVTLVAAGGARAAAQQRQVGAETDGVRLLVADRGERICVGLVEAQDADESCARPPRTPFRPEIRSVFTSGGPVVIVGMVSAAVATVEVAHGRDARTRVGTGMGRYTGRHAAEVRFFAASVDGVPRLLRFYDASGRLIGASDAYLEGPMERQDLASAVLRRGGTSSSRWQLIASAREELDPRPDRPDRMVRRLCLRYAVGNSAESNCTADDAALFRSAPQVGSACGRAPRLLYTVVAPGIRRLDVVLGSGRRVELPTRPLPATLGIEGRFVAAILPRTEAVRAIAGVDDRGAVLARAQSRAAPGGVGCRRGGGVGGYASFDPGSADENRADAVRLARDVGATTPAGGRLLLGERGDDLCVALVLGAEREGGCMGPPLDPGDPVHWLARSGDRAVFAGVTTPGGRPVELVLDDGTRLRPPLQEPAAYGGRYRQHVRVFAVDVPAGRRAARFISRDAAGRVVLGSPAFDRRAGSGLRSVLRSRAAGAALDLRARLERFDFSYEGERFPSRPLLCLDPRLGSRSLVDLDPLGCHGVGGPGRRHIAGVASCAARRVVFYGTLGRRDRGIEFLLADGRRLRAPVAAVRPTLAFDARVFALALPRRAAVRAVLVHRATSTLRIATPLAPAVRQCGYGLDLGGI